MYVNKANVAMVTSSWTVRNEPMAGEEILINKNDAPHKTASSN